MDYCFTYYPSSNRHLIDLFEKTLDNQTFTNLDKFFDTSGNSPELLYQKTFSLKIFSKNLTAQDNGLYIYPLLKTDLSILDFLGTENILFHRGLIYHILHQKTIPQERENDLNKINQFFATVIQQVIETKSSCLPASLSQLLDTIFHFNRIGLNMETCRTYIEILSNHMATPDTQPIINTFTINLTHIVFTAHVFFICMENFSPTFIFYNRKKLILEQQRAILIIERNDYSTLWKQISDHIDCLFNVSLSESFFKEYTKGGNEDQKQFLYKNLFEKWGNVFFPFTYSVSTSNNSTAHHITTLELRDICKEVYQSDSPDAYESLLPYSTHPSFKTLLR
nr:RF1 [Human betaherpesvirus 6A]